MNYRDAAYFRGLQALGEDADRERLAILNKPPAPNPPERLAPTRCRVLKAFYVGGKVAEVGAVVTLQRHDAESLAAIRKVEILA